MAEIELVRDNNRLHFNNQKLFGNEHCFYFTTWGLTLLHSSLVMHSACTNTGIN